MTIGIIRADALSALPHGFLGRRGGVSSGILAELNVGSGSGEDPDVITENRRRVVEAVLPGAKLATVYQVHSGDAVRVDEPWPQDERPRADAMVTDTPGLLLGILTADCAPVLFADAEAGVVGAAHAGWRGALAGVTDATVEAMERIGASRERIAAAVGPCIAQASYEVDEQFQQQFLHADPANRAFFIVGDSGKPHFDLEGYVVARLRRAGIADPAGVQLDTYSNAERLYSYRRATHRGEPNYGRQISLIGIAP